MAGLESFLRHAEVALDQAVKGEKKTVGMLQAIERLTNLYDLSKAFGSTIDLADLNQIIVKGSRDVTFHYLVQGVRRAFKDIQPVRIGYEFVPQSPSDTLQPYLTEEARRRLIANGTYNADGTVNMQTAERLGWTKLWADRKAAPPAARPPAFSGKE